MSFNEHILLDCRELRIQHRVKVHIHFFVSLALAGVTNILWYLLVHYELLVNQNHKTTVIYLNPVSMHKFCKDSLLFCIVTYFTDVVFHAACHYSKVRD